MFLKYFYDRKLAQASYLLACPGAGVAMVIDPSRDVQPYLDEAAVNGFQIIAVAETHIHADYVSGGRELAHRTGATLYLSGMGSGDLAYRFADEEAVQYVQDGDKIAIGDVQVKVMYTPGHTPEHICFMVTDTGATKPIGVFTGDFLFAGDIGRPDLLEEAVKVANTKEIGARQQFANIQRFRALPDYMQIWPGHGAGSACGKALGAIPSTTLGYEKLVNPGFNQPDEDTFVVWLLEGQPEPPLYFAQMKAVNKVGAVLLDTLSPVGQLPDSDFTAMLDDPATLVIDTRTAEDYALRHAPGTLYVPADSDNFSTYVGWYVDYEQQTVLIADEASVTRLVNELRAIGVDKIVGYFTPDVVDSYDVCMPQIDVRSVNERLGDDIVVLDVRGQSERDEQHIEDSEFIPMGYVPQRLDQLPRDQQIMVHCGGGVRSMVVASLLQNHGFDVVNIAGGIDAWERAGLPLVS